MTPVNFFDRTLIRHALRETERFGLTRRARCFVGEAKSHKRNKKEAWVRRCDGLNRGCCFFFSYVLPPRLRSFAPWLQGKIRSFVKNSERFLKKSRRNFFCGDFKLLLDGGIRGGQATANPALDGCSFAFLRVFLDGFFKPGAIHSKNSSFRRIFFDERLVLAKQMRDEFALEKICRIAHRLLMMPIKTKNVREKAYLRSACAIRSHKS